MDLVSNNKEIEISEEQVAHYLKNHPGFFLKRDDLLCELKLNHPSGGAVSLLERQVSLLRERNFDIRDRLNGLLENAGKNDQLFDKTKKLVLSLLAAKNLDNVASSCIRSLSDDFNMDFSSITLFGKPQHHRSSASRFVSVDDAYQQIPALLKNNKITCGVLRPEELQFLFPDGSSDIGSAAVAPLSFGNPLGILAIGSRDPHYFRSSMGTLFLDYIADVLNRVLPNHMKDSA